MISACQQLSMLHRLIDSVALLDMLASFALAVSPSLRDIVHDCLSLFKQVLTAH